MALVSSVYRLAPSDGYLSNEEERRRLKVRINRLITEYGRENVLQRIRAWPANRESEMVKNWLVVAVEEYVIHRSGTL
jgi:hypothetical protein